MSDKNKVGWNFDNSYSNLPSSFVYEISPIPVKLPELVVFNYNLADEIGLNFSSLDNKELAKIFSGNSIPKGSKSIAQAYAGHQFGHFTMLGDGRAVLLGEHISKKNKRFDIQFKGSGQTPFSRNGDGRAALSPMLREYLISEAMNSLNIPTTRSLAVVKTGEDVIREKPLPGAILTRVASSHIRVGTFQFIRTRDNLNELDTLVNYTIKRHFPEISKSKNKAHDLLNVLIDKQIELVVNWMRVGFIHGVMNTDNMAISGETIDYGPCAFMDYYDPKTVFSSIDKFGRYAFSNQPAIAKWNLARFAECLIPLIDEDEEQAIKTATKIIDNFQNIYEQKWLDMMKSKLGLVGDNKDDLKLINSLLNWMEKNKADYTNTFCFLMGIYDGDEIYKNKSFEDWLDAWKNRSSLNNSNKEKQFELMKKVNPVIIPRNHKVEEALSDAEKNNYKTLNILLSVIQNPYDPKIDILKFQTPAPASKEKYQTFCGT